MKVLKTLHLASFNGNIGDNANHNGFYKYLNKNKDFKFAIDTLEIREFYWRKRSFDISFVKLVNTYDLLIIGGGNYFELWVDNSPTGTSIAIDLELLKQIKTPIVFNALGVDSGQGVSSRNIEKFRNFLDVLIERKDFISIRNDGARQTIIKYIGKEYLEYIYHTVDAGFFTNISEPSNYYKTKKYIAINIASDMPEVRFKDISYSNFLLVWQQFISDFLEEYNEYEIVIVPHIFRDIGFINDLLEILDDETRRTKISIAALTHGENSFDEVMSIYKNASIVLANRFHANVCSIGFGTPTIGLVNYKQIQELYNELESDSYIDITKKSFNYKLLELIRTVKPYKMIEIEKKYQTYIQSLNIWLNNYIGIGNKR